MAWYVFLIQAAIMFGISLLLQPKMKFPKRSPLGEDDFEIPTAEEGRSLAVLFGKRRYGGPNVVWWGDLKIRTMTEKVKTGLFSSKKITVGYKYYLGMHMILGFSRIDGIKQIVVGEKAVWPILNDLESEAVDGVTSATIDAESIFGGSKKEGGISGTVDFEYGDIDQDQNDYLVSQLGGSIPAYRGQTGIVLRQVYLGTNAYIKPWSFLWKRTDRLVSGGVQWYLSKAVIGNDSLNVIHVIREILTDTDFGLGYPVSDINDTNFESIADICYDEGFGVALNWDASIPCEDIIGKLLEVIDGALFQNQTTGKFEITLAREDYTPGDLEIYDESDIVEIEDFIRPGFGEVTSKVTVRWTEIYQDEKRIACAEDPAVMRKQGSNIIEAEFDYQFIVDGTLANNIANRELKQMTSMLATMKLKCLKTMASIEPYSVFKISWPKLGLAEVIVRVAAIDYGTPQDNHMIVSVSEDVFGTAFNIYSDPPTTLWSDPVSIPVDTTYRLATEAPYFVLHGEISSESVLESLSVDASYILANAVSPSSDAFGFQLLIEDYAGSGYAEDGSGVFVPSATIDADIPIGGSRINDVLLENISNLDMVEIGSFALIDSEFVIIEDVDIPNSTIDIGRAVLDTIPTVHNADSRIWFIGSAVNMASREYTYGDSPRLKFLTETGHGVLAEAAATYIEATGLNRRQIRPYPPARLLINGISFPTHFAGQPTLTWKHRDRTNSVQLSTIVRYDYDGSYGPEATTTYTLKIYDEDNNLVRTELGLTGTTFNYTEAFERSDCSLSPTDPLNSSLRFVFYSVRDGYDSYQQYDFTVQRSSQGEVDAIVTTTGRIEGGDLFKGSSVGIITTTGDVTII